MEIRLAKTAGFCFGVDRAVQMTRALLDAGEKVATLGPLIHNPQVVAELERRGAKVADAPEQVPPGYRVVIRSHGVPQSVYDELAALGVPWQDATCPFVAKIHAIARRAEKEGACLAVAGDAAHPEVQGIVGHTRGETFVFADLAQLRAWKGPGKGQRRVGEVLGKGWNRAEKRVEKGEKKAKMGIYVPKTAKCRFQIATCPPENAVKM